MYRQVDGTCGPMHAYVCTGRFSVPADPCMEGTQVSCEETGAAARANGGQV